MSEYLDRDKVKEIVTRFTENLEKHFDCLIDDTKLITQICQLKPKNQVVIAEGEIDNIKWESPYNKIVFYFKNLPEMIGIKIIKNKKVKIILEEE